MCGLAGIVSRDGVDPAALGSMADAIAHRGPDGRGYLLHRAGGTPAFGRTPEEAARGRGRPQVGFAHLRLAIIDLREINDQPLFDSSGELALSYNGEIYNYVELRRELEGLGHEFRTSGDTEVLLAAYAEWGADCVVRLVGMWAFSILDARRDVVFLSRDRFGVKPLYWTLRGGALHFASEIKALLAVPGAAPEPNEEVVRRYLLTGGVDESEQTFFEGVYSLPAAHNALIPLDGAVEPLRPERYWSLPEEGYGGGVDEAAAEFRAMLSDSVRVHARSDVPVGTCLSGGLDSSAIVCVAEELRRDEQIPHYAHRGFGYLPEQAELSERPYMEEVVQRTGLEMTYVEVAPERFGSALVEIARQQDEPFGSASIAAQWFVFESAHRAGLKVMLDGQGADEVLGGYHYYFPLIASALLRARRPLQYARFARSHRRALGEPPLSRRYALASLAPAGLRRAAPERLTLPPAAALLAPDLRDRADGGVAGPPEFESVNEILAAHTTSLGLPSLLRFEDRNSMAHSIEARVPFLDHRLVEFAFRLPGDYKVHGVETKYVMREALKGVLPERIRTRTDKIGFRAEPGATWALAERNREALLAARTPYEERWFDRGALADLFAGSDRSAGAEFMLWRAINAKLWLRAFWDGGDPLA